MTPDPLAALLAEAGIGAPPRAARPNVDLALARSVRERARPAIAAAYDPAIPEHLQVAAVQSRFTDLDIAAAKQIVTQFAQAFTGFIDVVAAAGHAWRELLDLITAATAPPPSQPERVAAPANFAQALERKQRATAQRSADSNTAARRDWNRRR